MGAHCGTNLVPRGFRHRAEHEDQKPLVVAHQDRRHVIERRTRHIPHAKRTRAQINRIVPHQHLIRARAADPQSRPAIALIGRHDPLRGRRAKQERLIAPRPNQSHTRRFGEPVGSRKVQTQGFQRIVRRAADRGDLVKPLFRQGNSTPLKRFLPRKRRFRDKFKHGVSPPLCQRTPDYKLRTSHRDPADDRQAAPSRPAARARFSKTRAPTSAPTSANSQPK